MTERRCPSCRRHVEDRTRRRRVEGKQALIVGFSPAPPCKAGDIGVCFYCGMPMYYEADLSVRLATLADLGKLDPQQAFWLGAASGEIMKRRREAASTN